MSDVVSIVNSVRVMLILIFSLSLSFFAATVHARLNIAVERSHKNCFSHIFQIALCLFPTPLGKRNMNSPLRGPRHLGRDLFERWESHVVNKHTRNLVIGFYVEK